MKIRVRQILLVSAALLAVLAAGPARAAQDSPDRADKIRAVYVLNFVKYTQWPEHAFADAESPIVIAMVSREPFADLLRALVFGEIVHQRRVDVRHLQPPGADVKPDEAEDAWEAFFNQLRSAHVVFVGAAYQDHAPAIVRRLDGKTLTVGDAPNFARQGGMLGLEEFQNRIVFQANAKAIEKADLTVSSRVLRLARIVESE